MDFGDDDFMLDSQGAGCGGSDESNDEGGEDADEAQVNSDQFLQTNDVDDCRATD